MKIAKKFGVTLVELTVVILILSILASISLSVYTGYVHRARYAVARTTIKEIALNCQRYEVDLGQYPPSYSSLAGFTTATLTGSGFMTLALLHSMSGNANAPASPRWMGPYMEVSLEDRGNIFGGRVTVDTNPAGICILDPWGLPYVYVRDTDYNPFGTHQFGTPFYLLGETYYNPGTYQIYSRGANNITLDPPNAGTEADDVNNFNTP